MQMKRLYNLLRRNTERETRGSMEHGKWNTLQHVSKWVPR